jgi:hypothetical protein
MIKDMAKQGCRNNFDNPVWPNIQNSKHTHHSEHPICFD